MHVVKADRRVEAEVGMEVVMVVAMEGVMVTEAMEAETTPRRHDRGPDLRLGIRRRHRQGPNRTGLTGAGDRARGTAADSAPSNRSGGVSK